MNVFTVIALGSLVGGAALGLTAVWGEDLLSQAFVTKSITTMTILFVTSTLASIIYSLQTGKKD